MKHLLTTVAILALLITSHQSICQVNIFGSVVNAPKDAEIAIVYEDNPIEGNMVTSPKTRLSKNGTFKIAIDINNAKMAWLSIADKETSLFLVPKSTIYLSTDYTNFPENVHFSGKNAQDNAYLAAEQTAAFYQKSNASSMFDDANAFKLFVDSLEQLNIDFLKSYNSQKFSKEFKKHISNSIKYQFINTRWYFRLSYNEKTGLQAKSSVPDEYFHFLKSMNLNDNDAYDNDKYAVALMRYIYEYQSPKYQKDHSLSDSENSLLRIKNDYNYRKSIFRENVLDHQLTLFIKDCLQENTNLIMENPAFMDELLVDYKKTCKNKDYQAIIDKVYAGIKKLSTGNKAPDFVLEDIAGHAVSLSSLKGKIVFIDFWATWCVPCLAAMPVTHKLIAKFKDNKDVIFLNINVKDDKERWRKFVLEKELPGENLFATKELSDKLYNNFNIQGIPRYILIDKEGNIMDINADNSQKTSSYIQKAISRD